MPNPFLEGTPYDQMCRIFEFEMVFSRLGEHNQFYLPWMTMPLDDAIIHLENAFFDTRLVAIQACIVRALASLRVFDNYPAKRVSHFIERAKAQLQEADISELIRRLTVMNAMNVDDGIIDQPKTMQHLLTAMKSISSPKSLERVSDRMPLTTSTPVEVLRWLAVLPGAISCALLVTLPIHWIVELKQLLSSNYDSIGYGDAKIPLATFPPEVLERLGYAFFTPLVMIIVGATIAPKLKFHTSIALAVLWGVIFAFVTTFVFIRGLALGGWLFFATTCLLNIAGIGLALLRVHKGLKGK